MESALKDSMFKSPFIEEEDHDEDQSSFFVGSVRPKREIKDDDSPGLSRQALEINVFLLTRYQNPNAQSFLMQLLSRRTVVAPLRNMSLVLLTSTPNTNACRSWWSTASTITEPRRTSCSASEKSCSQLSCRTETRTRRLATPSSGWRPTPESHLFSLPSLLSSAAAARENQPL